MTTQAVNGKIPDENYVPTWDLGDRLGKSLRVRGIAVQDMAESFGVTRHTISNWINGRTVPGKSQLFFWAVLTGVSLEWLENGEGPTQNAQALRSLPRLDSNQQPAD